MNKFFAVLALAATVLPAGVLARGTEQRFTRAGITYVYTVAPASGGRQVIAGRRLSDGSAFRLIVDGSRVDGTSGGQPVSFRAPAPGGVTLAAR